MTKLKPCPFCGEKVCISEMKKAVGYERWSVGCTNSRCIAHELFNPFIKKYISEKSAIEAWNRRADNGNV